ncbi:gamma-aminobutyric acid type B receptor subunit 2 isoform X2 [Leptopilina heterotoma]|uniref:gamma-aminobutyric acid type B receptor subunit 2 isoform X2 n=1 Tax=Leptopilina heterotoma TaxID=63436 RepID=UPI001CA9A8D4|nr:gamma-aminobutyric acid type B receptor subunit 2 isoform X2 [Leptopilina heterotoma]
MSRACKHFFTTFPFVILFLPFHRPHLIVLLFNLLCFSSQVFSSERTNSTNNTNGISLSITEKMGRYEGRNVETLDNRKNLAEDNVLSYRNANNNNNNNNDNDNNNTIDDVVGNNDNRSLLSLEQTTKDLTNNDRCRFNNCSENVEYNGFPVTVLNSISNVNVSNVNSEDSSSELPFTGFESLHKFPIKITQKPPYGASGEKFDRRHFGPSKLEITRQASNISTLEAIEALPDLPMSPSRDVVPHRRKGSTKEIVDIGENKELREEVNGEEDNFTLSFNDTSETFSTEDIVNSKNAQVSTIASVPITTRKMSWLPNFHKNLKNDGDDNYRNGNWSKNFPHRKVNLTILGLFELTQKNEPRPEGPSELQAAKLAIDKINQMELLPRFHLRLHHNDTQCDPGVAVDRFFHAIYSSNKNSLMPLLLGTACSEVSETLAKIVPYWNVVQVSFGSTTPALSDPTEFPLFIRTVAPDSSHNSARIALIKHFGWDTVSAFSQNGDMYALAVNDLVTELEQANITCTATITFAENDYKEQLRTLKDLDTRIIIGSFSPRLAPHVFCEAWKLGMHGGDYAWILPGDTIDLSGMTGDWWHIRPDNCSPSQLLQTLDGLIIVKSHGAILSDDISHSGLTSSEFTAELAKRGVTVSQYAAQTYDAVWAVAVAMNKSEAFLNKKNVSFAQYSHKRQDLAYYLLGQMKDLHFNGVSGPVSFDGADRVGITAFYQMQGHDQRRIAIFTPDDGQLIMNCPGCAITRWPGGHPPVARRVFRLRVVTVAPAAFLVVTCLSSVGVTLALAFLAFNLHFRKHKSIKLSSPRLNNMAAVGCGLVYGAVVLLGLDHATLPDSDDYFPVVCTARVYLLSAGFSLAFGSMFTKTYRVHRIFTRSRSGVVKNKLLQDTQLISLICVLLLIDGLVVTLWVTMDPMQRHLRNLTLEINPQERGVVYQPQVEVCRSQHTNGWLGALYVYKGLLLVVGVYMAWETRHVKVPALNDSQYIGMSVYSVVITSGIVVALANLISDQATLVFVTITALILASTTATLALLFLPQLTNILSGERADPVIQSLGLKIECNTRRFVTDDRRELQYRVEVQNRVYRREMAQLELELARLEKQLGQENVDPSQGSSSASIPQRNPSISGGLPLLLLSVLPPVIPRASWPSADPSGITKRHATRYRSV